MLVFEGASAEKRQRSTNSSKICICNFVANWNKQMTTISHRFSFVISEWCLPYLIEKKIKLNCIHFVVEEKTWICFFFLVHKSYSQLLAIRATKSRQVKALKRNIYMYVSKMRKLSNALLGKLTVRCLTMQRKCSRPQSMMRRKLHLKGHNLWQ